MTEITIVFGTETGNSESLARDTAKRLQALSVAARVIDLEEFTLEDVASCAYLLMITSTYGEGEPPSNAEAFYEDLMSGDAPRLDQLKYSVCALGDSDYDLFCQCGKDFDERFAALGAQRLTPRVDCDAEYVEFEDWWEGVRQKVELLGLNQKNAASAPPSAPSVATPPTPPATKSSSQSQPSSFTSGQGTQPNQAPRGNQPNQALRSNQPNQALRGSQVPPPPAQVLETTQLADIGLLDKGQRSGSSLHPLGSKKNPLFAEILENYNLNHPESQKETRHVTISLEGTELGYEVGDALGVFPRNESDLVNELLYYTGLNRDDRVEFEGEVFNLFYLLKYRKDIVKIDNRIFEIMSPAHCPPHLAHLLRDRKAAKAYIEEHHIIDLAKEGCLRTSASELISALRTLAPRLYSISSSPKAHIGQVHLTVDVLRYELHGLQRRGVASNFLATAETGSHVAVYVNPTKEFKLCAPERPIIMIGPGTGIAPFKAMLEEREVTQAPGQSWLFFGAQRSSQDFLYRDLLEGWVNSGRLSQLDCAWSRDQAQKIYVQDLMYKHALGIWKWLEAGAYIYICGDAKRMAKDVHKTFVQIIQEQGRVSPAEAEDYMSRLRSEKRYLRDVY